MNETTSNAAPTTTGNAKLIYILYLASLAIGVTAIVGLVMAYVNRDEAPGWLETHYRFQIRTFWIGALYLLPAFILAPVLIGSLIGLFWIFWLIIRCAKGMKYLELQQACPDPTGWLF